MLLRNFKLKWTHLQSCDEFRKQEGNDLMFRVPLDPNQGNNFTTQLSKALVIKERWDLAKLCIKCKEISQAVSDTQGQQVFTCHQTSSDSGWMMWKKEKKEE